MVTIYRDKKQDILNPIVSVIIPIGNRYSYRVRNCVKSLKQQTEENIEIIFSDYGSTDKSHKKLMSLLKPFDCTVYYCKTDALWGLAPAANIGIKRAKGKMVIKIDADLILEPDVIKDTLLYAEDKKKIVIRKPIFLPKEVDLTKLSLPKDYAKLREAQGNYFGASFGAFFSAPRNLWHKIHGFDERMRVWGPTDWDLLNRTLKSGERYTLIGERIGKVNYGEIMPKKNCILYHQWHPQGWLQESMGEEFFKSWRKKNQELTAENKERIVVNPNKWGEG